MLYREQLHPMLITTKKDIRLLMLRNMLLHNFVNGYLQKRVTFIVCRLRQNGNSPAELGMMNLIHLVKTQEK